jgi:serine/threonine protein kinase
MAPEQAKGDRRIGPAVDVYASGVILYEMLTRRRPFDGESYNEVMYKILTEPFTPLRELAPGVPVELEEVVSRAMSKDAGSRYSGAAAMREALSRAVSSERETASSMAPTAVVSAVVDERSPWRKEGSRSRDRGEPPSRPKTPTSTGSHSSRPISSRQSRYLAEEWYFYKGKEILVRDYSGLDPSRSERVIESSLLSTHDLVLEGKRGILMLIDMTGWTADRKAVEKMKKIARLIGPYAHRLAAVGAAGLLTILVNAMRRESGHDIGMFDAREEAMDWLAS